MNEEEDGPKMEQYIQEEGRRNRILEAIEGSF